MTRIPIYRHITRTIALAGAAVVLASISNTGNAAQVWKLDFGASTATTGQAEAWNNISGAIATNDAGALLDLVDTTNTVTAVDFLMISRFGGENMNGTTTSTTGFPSSATRDSFYGNTEAWEGRTNMFPVFKLTSLEPGLPYDLTFYASRTGVGDNRETIYTVTGASVGSVSLNVANNVDNTVSLFGVMPNEFGEIQIELDPGPNNNNANHFTYLGVMTMTVPEPAAAVFLLGGIGVLMGRRQRRSA